MKRKTRDDAFNPLSFNVDLARRVMQRSKDGAGPDAADADAAGEPSGVEAGDAEAGSTPAERDATPAAQSRPTATELAGGDEPAEAAPDPKAERRGGSDAASPKRGADPAPSPAPRPTPRPAGRDRPAPARKPEPARPAARTEARHDDRPAPRSGGAERSSAARRSAVPARDARDASPRPPRDPASFRGQPRQDLRVPIDEERRDDLGEFARRLHRAMRTRLPEAVTYRALLSVLLAADRQVMRAAEAVSIGRAPARQDTVGTAQVEREIALVLWEGIAACGRDEIDEFFHGELGGGADDDYADADADYDEQGVPDAA